MKRIVPIIFLLQGICPILVFGFVSTNRNLFAFAAIVYVLLTCGLWKAKRSAYIIATLVTLAQVLTVCSPSFTWHLLVGLGGGPFLTLPLSQADYGVYGRIGVIIGSSFGESNIKLHKIYSIDADTFVLFNLFSAILSFLLIAQFRRIGKEQLKS
jgi:hypothetical protein